MRIAKVAAVGLSLAAGAALALLLPDAEAARNTSKDGAAEVAATAFLKSLPADLRASASFPLDSPERLNWNFIPKDRAGVSLLQLDDTQSEELGPLLASALSPEGLLEARGVMKHENILRRVETEKGIDATRRDPGRYYTSIFGKPQSAQPWAWRFEGHHLSINVTQLPGEAAVVAPLFIGANPARVLTGPNTGFRLLAEEEDLGRELMTILSDDQRRTALIQDEAFGEILTKNDPKVQPLELAGLAASAMTDDERAVLHRLLDLYIGRLNAAYAKDVRARMARAGFGKIRFAWAGGIEIGQPHYYRVHGPTLLIEYDDTQNDANHIHTVYRDLDRDFGGDLLRAHYRGQLSN